MSSTLNPAIILGGQPVQPQNALQTISQISQLKNAQQENQLRGIQMQGALQENQQRQLQLDQTKALNDAYMSAVNPDGSIDTGKLTDALSQGGHGSAIPSVLKGIQDYQKSTADTVEAKTKAATAQADHGGAIGSAVLAAGGDPHLAMSLVTSGLKSGTIDPNNAQQILGHIQQLMTADPTGEQARQFARQAATNLVAQSPAQQELAIKKQTADAAKVTAETKQKAEQREQGIADINKPKLMADADLAVAKSIGQRLSAARDVGTYQSIISSLTPDEKEKAMELGFTDPSKVNNVRDLMQATKAAGDLTKSAHERTEEAQGIQRLGIESQRANAETSLAQSALGDREINSLTRPHQATLTAGQNQMERISEAQQMLSSNNAETQALAVPKVLTALVSGNGTGVRLTRPEMTSILKARGVAGTAEAWLQGLANGKKLAPEQVSQLNGVLSDVGSRIQQKMKIANDTINQIQSAPDRASRIKADQSGRENLNKMEIGTTGKKVFNPETGKIEVH